MKRFSTAVWNGPGITGSGVLASESRVINGHSFTFDSRFNNAAGTNPEELLAAACASDFAMKLSFILGEAGFIPEGLEVSCYIGLENGAINAAHLTIREKNKMIPAVVWQNSIAEAENNSPVSRALHIKITSELMA